jgi:hypothetical protein
VLGELGCNVNARQRCLDVRAECTRRAPGAPARKAALAGRGRLPAPMLQQARVPTCGADLPSIGTFSGDASAGVSLLTRQD